MVVESPRVAGRKGASARTGRLSYFRISGVEWLFAFVASLGISATPLVVVGPLDPDASGSLARSAAPIVLTMAAIGLLTSGRRVRGRHRRRTRPAPVEAAAWAWAGAGVLLIAGAAGARALDVVGSDALLVPVGLAGVALLGVAMVRIPRLTSNRHGERRVRWDAFAAAVASGCLTWVAIDPFDPIGFAAVAVAAWLVGSTAFAALRSPLHRSDIPLASFALGALGLLGVQLLSLQGTGGAILPLIEAASGASVLVSVIAVRQPRVRRIDAVRPGPVALIAPYAPAAVLAGVAVYRLVVDPSEVVVPAGGLLVVGGAFVASRLAASREAMVALERERDRMVASVSHELRTPLTALTGFSDLLASDWRRLDDDQREEMVAIIRDESRRVSGLVSDMASLVADRMQSVDLDIRQLDGKAVVASAIRAVFERDDLGGLGVTTRIEPYLEVMADAARLQQVLVALIDNARRYGASRILVDAHREGAWRVIEVHDDGPGLAEEDEEVVWDRFRRGSTDLNARVPGAGLGLTKSRALVEAHGGELSHRRSEDLGGACFSLRLPLDRDEVPSTAAAPVRSTFPARGQRIHSPHPGPVVGRFGPSPALSERQSLPSTRMSTGGNT